MYKKCNFIECNSVEITYYQRNRDVTLKRAKNYYENDKERLRFIWRRKKIKRENMVETDVWRNKTKTKRTPKKLS